MLWLALTSPLQVIAPPQTSFHCCLLKQQQTCYSLSALTFLRKTGEPFAYISSLTVFDMDRLSEYHTVHTYLMTGHWTLTYCVDHFWLDSVTLRSCHPADVVLSLWGRWRSCSLTYHTDTSYCGQRGAIIQQAKYCIYMIVLKMLQCILQSWYIFIKALFIFFQWQSFRLRIVL